MKKINKKAAFLAGTMIALTLLGGCGKKEEVTTEEAALEITPVATMDGSAEDIVVIRRDGYVLSDLTGEWIEEEFANQRPLCVMISNIKDALPQYDISKAAVTYEIIVEGGITRYMCVFDRYDNIDKLGSVRSARVPFVQLAKMHDGLYAHFGFSPTAQNMIETDSSILSLNGLYLEGIMYYRDSERYAPHNAFTNSEMIAAGIENKGYSTIHDENYTKMLAFNYEDTNLEKDNPQPANKVTTNMSNYSYSSFTYNPDDGRYYREEYGDIQIDASAGEQLSYKNVIVMLVEYTTQVDGAYDFRFVTWDNGMDAYYFTDGQYVKVKWNNNKGVPKFYYEDGTEVRLNPGNTYITLFDYTAPEGIIIE